ncbi:hypothetical protein L7F22_059885 [Adiantum nelumboides]|nr:hypothetical protein [Adiantum nelumboides]
MAQRVSHDENTLFKAQLVSFMETLQQLAKHPKIHELLQGSTQVVISPPFGKEDSHAKGSYDTFGKAPMVEKLSRKHLSWANFLSTFHFQLVHVAGKNNVVADALSGSPHVAAVSIAYHHELDEMRDHYSTDEDFAEPYDAIVRGEHPDSLSLKDGFSNVWWEALRFLTSSTKVEEVWRVWIKNFQASLPLIVPQHYSSIDYLDGPPLAPGGVFLIKYNPASFPHFDYLKAKWDAVDHDKYYFKAVIIEGGHLGQHSNAALSNHILLLKPDQ